MEQDLLFDSLKQLIAIFYDVSINVLLNIIPL